LGVGRGDLDFAYVTVVRERKAIIIYQEGERTMAILIEGVAVG